jgi:hypothetical protein
MSRSAGGMPVHSAAGGTDKSVEMVSRDSDAVRAWEFGLLPHDATEAMVMHRCGAPLHSVAGQTVVTGAVPHSS